MPRPRLTPSWRTFPTHRPLRPQLRARSSKNTTTTTPPPPTASRLDRLTSKLPRRLQSYTAGLRNAPVSHVVSFLILHEITAVVPLVGLFALFHYTSYAPVGYMTEHFGEYVEAGVSRFERYFTRKGWFGFSSAQQGIEERRNQRLQGQQRLEQEVGRREEEGGGGGGGGSGGGSGGRQSSLRRTRDAVERRDEGERKYRILVEVALAYAATKALLPVRIVGSVWATPWFARVFSRIRTSLAGK